ncbi:unnamed protein product [Parnassius mnemosyne]|uniref:Cyclic nucleotide-binding domain-containing protein n=2 Tax=Parnassius mnemosyne TaxID=213953 RepID=A0AAV1KDQ6_9NEOP
MNSPELMDKYEDDEDDDSPLEENYIRWSNLLFLPFHPVAKLLVLLSVIVKSILGPLQSIYPIVYCWDVLDRNIYLWLIKAFYFYGCDLIYGIDTCLHIMHRQVTDEAMRREYLPKSAFLLFIDIACLIPFFRLMIFDDCTEVKFFPNILCFIEFVTIYRVAEYFSLLTTHNYWKLCMGFTIMYFLTVNCISCFLILFTEIGLCKNCVNTVYYYKDWRKFVMHKLNETSTVYSTYVYGASFIFSFPLNVMYDEIKASTLLEYLYFSMVMIFFYVIKTFIVFPKLVAEALLRLRHIYSFYPRVRIIIAETKRRNPSPKAHIDVKNFYALVWKQHRGITRIPQIITELPRYLRIDIKQDLVWPVFYHSPTLRKTSNPYQRWLCNYIHLDYKLPGSRFFVGLQCQTHLYYIKSGIVELISNDDGITPIISVTSGTIFGDISFFLPPLERKVIVRCLSYCEVFYINRADVLKSLHKFPEDRKVILQRVRDKIKHAHTLFTCKNNVRGLDRAEDEGIAWIKKRWWEISNAISHFNIKQGQENEANFGLSEEEAIYHCAKYIGQLVLCTDTQLKKNSLFASVDFPFILVPNSNFSLVWHKIVMVTVSLVLILYPPNITRAYIPTWFYFFQLWTDFIYTSDLCVSLLTATESQAKIRVNFATVMLARFKCSRFFFDVLSTIWVEHLVTLLGYAEYYYPVQFNRLIKVYILFSKWSIGRNHYIYVFFNVCLIHFIFVYVLSYLMFELIQIFPELNVFYFFGKQFCISDNAKRSCTYKVKHVFQVFTSWLLEYLFSEFPPLKLVDIYVAMIITYVGFLIFLYCKSALIGTFHANNKEESNFQYFVTNIKKHYKQSKIHPDLLKRLDRYLICHWKYYKGMDVLYPNLLQNEPYDIYWKVHGEVAEKIIRKSRAFLYADPSLIRELAYNAKFLMLPKKAALIIFGIQPKNVTWLVQGCIKCEYHNEKGELLKTFYQPGDMLAFTSAFFGIPSLRTYSANTDCEVLFINITEFFNITKRYPAEHARYEDCLNKFKPRFEKIIQNHVQKHRDYQKKIRQRIFHSRLSVVDRRRINRYARGFQYLTTINIAPASKFMRYWMLLRAVIVCVSIISAALQGGSGAYWRWPLMIISAFCDCISIVDIVLKMFIPYYDKRGLLITDIRACIKHYLVRGFLMDVIGVTPFYELFMVYLNKDIDENDALLINTLSRFAHLYLVVGYFDYLADTPTVDIALIMVLKWKVISILLMCAASHYFVKKCIYFNWDSSGTFTNATLISKCWLPTSTDINQYQLTQENIRMIFAQSLNLAQSGLMRIDLGMFKISRDNISTALVLLSLGCSFWFVLCYRLTLVVLNTRSNTLFQHGVFQLKRFLEAERIEKDVINSAQRHFMYVWQRTKGINIQHLMNERISVVFRQDLNYYFFKKTLAALNTLLQGGEQLERQLATASVQMYFLPGQEIVREMDLAPWVYVVHRGKIAVKREGEKLAILTKGAIFGQLDGIESRPVRISAEAEGYADVLQISIVEFQEALDNETRRNIESDTQSKLDFMSITKHITEDPYDTIQYILRGKKAIKLPWMQTHVDAQNGTWYSRWLFITWLIEPVVTSVLVLSLETVPDESTYILYWILLVLDIVHFLHFLSDFFMMELVVVKGKCVMRTLKYRKLLDWGCYADIISLVVPLVTFIWGNWLYQLVKLVRLRLLYDFYNYFCTGFQSRFGSLLLKFISVLLILHAMTCGWIMVACREEEFPVNVPEIPPHINATIDYSEWMHPKDRKRGCATVTKTFQIEDKNQFSFVVPRTCKADYIVSMTYILILYTHTEMESVLTLNLKQVFYKIVINFIIYLLDIWILSVAISAVYTKFSELYDYDYNVANLITYLKHTGLSPTLLQTVENYTKHLWQRQRGNWLPELAQNAPQCLREDIFGALYMYHLMTPPLLRDLPHYFIRQLVTRLNRVVIFPGKMIVQEGDIFPCMYFIHEGEVEKWVTDKGGDKKMISLLSTNDYFGFIPGLFPNSPFQFTYMSRTVVDVVFLRFKDWQDLLHGYPKIKYSLYTAAKQLKKEMMGKN